MVGAGESWRPCRRERLRPLTIAEQGELKRITAGEQRAGGPGEASDGQCWRVAGGPVVFRQQPGWRGFGVRARSRISCGDSIRVGLGALKIAAGRGRRPDLRRGWPGARDRGDGPAVSRSKGRWDSNLVAEHPGAKRSDARGLPGVGATTIRRVLHDAGSSYQRTADVVPNGHSATQAQGWGGGRSSIRRRKKKGGHRPSVPVSRSGWPARLVPGRGRSVPGDSAARDHLGTGR